MGDWVKVQRRRSRVAGLWGLRALHANEWGGLVVGRRSLRTLSGWALRTPWHVVQFSFRRREVRL